MVLISGTGFTNTSSGRAAVDCSSMIHSSRYGRTLKRAGLVRGAAMEGTDAGDEEEGDADEDEVEDEADGGVGDGGSTSGAGTAAEAERETDEEDEAGFSSPKRTKGVDNDEAAPMVGGDGSR